MGSFNPEEKMDRVRAARLDRGKGKGGDTRPAMALCHPQRGHVLRGLCRQCYDAQPLPVREQDARDVKALTNLQDDVKALETMAREAKEILRRRLPDYARLHFLGAEIAALKGDTRPTEWALQSVKDGKATTVDPPIKALPVGEGGVKVFIGMKISGLQNASGTSNVIEAESASTD